MRARRSSHRKRRTAPPPVVVRRRKPASGRTPVTRRTWADEPFEDWGVQDEGIDRWLLEREAEDIERDDH
jgi:hypothetical protein